MGPSPLNSTRVEDYREEVMLALASARDLAAESIKVAQKHYKIIMTGGKVG